MRVSPGHFQQHYALFTSKSFSSLTKIRTDSWFRRKKTVGEEREGVSFDGMVPTRANFRLCFIVLWQAGCNPVKLPFCTVCVLVWSLSSSPLHSFIMTLLLFPRSSHPLPLFFRLSLTQLAQTSHQVVILTSTKAFVCGCQFLKMAAIIHYRPWLSKTLHDWAYHLNLPRRT